MMSSDPPDPLEDVDPALELEPDVHQPESCLLRGREATRVVGAQQEIDAVDRMLACPLVQPAARPLAQPVLLGPADRDAPEGRVPLEDAGGLRSAHRAAPRARPRRRRGSRTGVDP